MKHKKMIGIFEIVSESFDIFLANWKKYILLSAIATIPTILFLVIALGLGLSVDKDVDLYSLFKTNSIQIIVTVLSFFILQIFVQTIIYTSNLLISDDRKLSVKQALTKSWNLLMPISIAGLITFAIILGGFVLFIIPGLVFAIWYVYTLLCVIDGKRKMEALRSSKSLVKGRFWQTLIRIFVPSIIFGIAGYVVLMPFNIVSSLLNSFTQNNSILAVITGIGSVAQSMLTTPLTAIAIYVLYKNAKNTAEHRE